MKLRFRWSQIYRLYERIEPLLKYSVSIEDKPRGERAVILAPHIDDETIGCGGVMMKHVAAGNRVAILTFADCTVERVVEGRAAGKIVGVHRQDFLPFASNTLLEDARAAEEMTKFLASENPDVIYVPSMFDRHTDHLAVNILLARYVRRNGLGAMIYGYEVGSTLTPNVAVNITAEQPRKSEALACFASQNRTNNWHDAALALNRYRGVTTGAGQYAEAFLRMTAERHEALLKEVGA